MTYINEEDGRQPVFNQAEALGKNKSLREVLENELHVKEEEEGIKAVVVCKGVSEGQEDAQQGVAHQDLAQALH